MSKTLSYEIKTEGGESIQNTVKSLLELKEGIKALEEQLSGLDFGSKEFEETKKSLDALKGSYNEITKATNQTSTAFGDLQKQLKVAKNDLASFASGTKEFKEAQKRVQALSSEIGDLNTQSGLGGTGIEKLQKSFGLLGDSVGSLDFGKAKIGLQGVGAAMKAIPIFLIIEGIKYLYDNFEKLSKGSGFLGKALRFIGDVIQYVIDKFTELTDWLGLTNSALDKQGEAIQKNADKSKEALDKQVSAFDRQIAVASAAGKNTVALEKAKQEAIVKTNLIIAKQIEAFVRAGGALDDEKKKLLTASLEAIKEAKNQEKVVEIKDNKEKLEAYKKFQEDKKKEDEKTANDLFAELNKNEDNILASQNARREREKKEAEDLSATRKKSLEELKALQLLKDQQDSADFVANEEKLKNDKAKRIAFYNETIDLTQQFGDSMNALFNQIESNRLSDLESKNSATLSEIEKQKKAELSVEGLTEKQKADIAYKFEKQKYEQDLAFAKARNKAAEKAFKVNKAFQLANAVVNATQAVLGQLGSPPYSYESIARAAAVGIIGAAQIATIAATKFNPDSTPEAPSPPQISASVDTGGSGNSASEATINSGTLFSTGLGGTRQLGSGGSNNQSNEVRAYVIESDITTAQQRQNLIEQKATF